MNFMRVVDYKPWRGPLNVCSKGMRDSYKFSLSLICCLASADIKQNVLYSNGIQILLIIYFKRDTQRGKDTDRQRGRETDRQTDRQRQRERYGIRKKVKGCKHNKPYNVRIQVFKYSSIQVADVVMLQMSKTEARPYVEENSYNNFLDY